jgi:signal transduction histidine kinase
VDCDDGFARLTVSDTEVDSVFERFFRSTRSQERASQGTGPGLAITKSIVERNHRDLGLLPLPWRRQESKIGESRQVVLVQVAFLPLGP